MKPVTENCDRLTGRKRGRMLSPAALIAIGGLVLLTAGLMPGWDNVTQPIARADPAADSLAPLAAVPGEPYTTAVAYDGSANAYVWTFSGAYTTTYTLDLDDAELQTGRLRVGARVNAGPVAYPIAGAGPRYRRQDTSILEPAGLASVATIQLDSHGLAGERLRLDYTVTVDGASDTLTKFSQIEVEIASGGRHE